MINNFRLFYLCQDTIITSINEESFFNFLTWLLPALSGIFVSILLGENFLYDNGSHTPYIFYSSCSKKSILWEETRGKIVYLGIGISFFPIIATTIIIHVVIYIRQRQLEKERVEGSMGLTYNRDGVPISRKDPRGASHKLWKHNRTVVTPEASLFSFLFMLLYHFAHIYFLFAVESPYHSTFGQSIPFLGAFSLFFLFNFIETILSPKLRNSLFEILPWYGQQEYNIVNV